MRYMPHQLLSEHINKVNVRGYTEYIKAQFHKCVEIKNFSYSFSYSLIN